jgi:hypothetical protein
MVDDDGTTTYNAPDRPKKGTREIVDLTRNVNAKKPKFDLDKIVIDLASVDREEAEMMHDTINHRDNVDSSTIMDDYDESAFGPDVKKTNTTTCWDLYNKSGSGAINDNNSHQQLRKCSVCLNEDATHFFVPCNHLCLCEKCKVFIDTGKVTYFEKKCFVCRTPYTSISKIFFV